jgi:chemotaxis protein methyltransferase CheR
MRLIESVREELMEMIDQATTNRTDFFRELSHVACLTRKAPGLLQPRRSLAVWSACCSGGEERYTLVTVLNEAGCTVLATDISTQALEKASSAIYTPDTVAPIPIALRKKYLLAGKSCFDKPTQGRIVRKLCDYLFMGHSEPLLGIDVPLAQAAQTVSRRVR